jgi:hypothetical protein
MSKATPNIQKSGICDACHVSGDGDHPLEVMTIQGVNVVACVDPVACRARAQKLGIYKRV